MRVFFVAILKNHVDLEWESCPNQLIKLLLGVIRINFSILLEELLHTPECIWMHVDLIAQ